MRVTKWIFFGYLALTALVVLGIGASFMLTPARDPNTYFLSYGSDIKSLDPAEINDVESDTIAANIFECLYVYKYGVTPYELQPCLAEGMPEVSPDGLTMRLHIKKGVHYYDPEKRVFPSGTGPEVTAADFIYAWKRVSNFKLASTQYTGVFEGKVEDLDDWYAYTEKTPAEQIDWDRPVSGLQSPDRYTLVIKLVKRDPQLRYNLAHTPTAALCRQVAEYWGDKLKDHPVGTGPYMLEEQLKEQRIVLAANPVYRGGPDVESDKPPAPEERLPHIARVQFDYFAEALPEWLLFRQGMFDAAGIPKDTFKQAINATGSLTPEMVKEGIELIKAPEADVWYYGFNMSDPLVGKNKALRQAMSMAFDRESYIKVYLNGRGQPAIGPIPPGFPTYDANQVNPYTRFDLAAAKAKLKEAERFQGGPIPPMTLLMPGTDTSVRQIAENFVSEMEALGLTMKIEYSNWAAVSGTGGFQAGTDLFTGVGCRLSG